MMISQDKKIAWIFLLGLICGVAGETLLFIHRQCGQLESMLMDDFRIVAFLSSDQTDAKAKVLEEKIRALPGARDARYVSRESALAFLQEQDPELVGSVALLGENPLHAGFEIRLLPEAIAKMPGWLQALSEFHDLGDVQYKPRELTAIMQMQFYKRFLDVSLSLAAVAWLMGALAGVWIAATRPETRRAIDEWLRVFGSSMAGTFCGMGAIFLAALPLKSLSQMWVWPSWQSHFALVAVGMIGAGLFPDMKTGLRTRERHMSSHSWTKGASDEPKDIVGAGR